MKFHLNEKQALFDTIGFWIPIGKLTSLDTKLFDSYDTFKNRKKYISKLKTDETQYHPQLSLRRFELNKKGHASKNYQEALFVQVSAPKLILGSSISDITCAEYNNFIRRILYWLNKFGIQTKKEAVSSATVYEIHPVLNIWMPDFYNGFDSYDIFDELAKYWLPYLDSTSIVFSDQTGWEIQWHNGKNEVVIYDKRAEIKRNGFNCLPSSINLPVIKDGITVMEKIKNVIRFEIRLRSGVNIRQKKQNLLCEGNDLPANFTVKDAFETDFCHRIKQVYANKLFKNRPVFHVSDYIADNPDIMLSKYKPSNEKLKKAACDLQMKNLSRVSLSATQIKILTDIGKGLPPNHTDEWISYLQNQIENDMAVQIRKRNLQ